jgi:hypothetical protein
MPAPYSGDLAKLNELNNVLVLTNQPALGLKDLCRLLQVLVLAPNVSATGCLVLSHLELQ